MTSQRDDQAFVDVQHLVVPGQVIAESAVNEDGADNVESSSSFLRGHGTYLEQTERKRRLVASVTGIVHRINKLVQVESLSLHVYNASVGDLVVGRIVSIGNARWNVQLTSNSKLATLPLSGVHLPGGIQRIRTAEDARDMRSYLQEGDLVAAEVHKAGGTGGGGASAGGVVLHTRSVKLYGKLENGCTAVVPPALMVRQKHHSVNLTLPTSMDADAPHETFQLLLGCNGMIWIQRQLATGDSVSSPTARDATTSTTTTTGHQELTEVYERQRREHAEQPVTTAQRRAICRLRNSIACLRISLTPITAVRIKDVYLKSIDAKLEASHLLQPQNAVRLTEALAPL